jgi:hypothetical protein
MRAGKGALVAFGVALVAFGAAARADDTFESKAASAQRVHRVENLVWALTAPCDQGDDTEQRQCRFVRDRRAAELTGQMLLVDADRDAFEVGAWDAHKKSAPLLLSTCIRCAGVEIDGKTWYVVGSGAAPRPEGGRLRGARLGDTARAFADEAAAKSYAARIANARVQLIVKVPAKPRWSDGGRQGIYLDVIGYRVVAPCDGAVIFASPTSEPIEADKAACNAIQSKKPSEDAPKLDELTPSAIAEALRPVVNAANQCFNQHGVAGTAKLKLTVNGDGTIAKYEQQGDFEGTPTGKCIDKAIERAAFPRTKRPVTSFVFPVQLK